MTIDAHDLIFEYFDDVYPHSEFNKNVRSINDEVIRRFYNEKSKIRILDLCCGTGRALSLFSPKDNYELFGIDIRECFIKKAKQHFNDATIENYDVTKLSRSSKPSSFPDSFHCITMTGATIIHFKENKRKKIFESVNGLLKEGGIFIFNVFEKYSPNDGDGKIAFIRLAKTLNAKDVIIVYHRIIQSLPSTSRQIVYLIELDKNKENSVPKIKWGEVIFYYLTREDVEKDIIAAGFSELSTLKTDYGRTEFIIAQK